MTDTNFRRIGDFRRVSNTLLGQVLPEFGVAYGLHTLWRSTGVVSRFVFVSNHRRSAGDANSHVICRTNLPTRRAESTKPTAPKSP